MRTNALFDRYEVFVAAATVGAHAHAKAEGFRQRDVKFLVELCSNWIEHSIQFQTLVFQNTQVARFLGELVRDGFARKLGRSERPCYKLTRSGLIELLSRIVNEPYYEQPERFFFVYYFIENYRPRILELIKAEGKQFPYAVEVELKALLDSQHLKERQRVAAEKELQKLEVRIGDALKTSKLTIDGYRNGRSTEQIVAEVEKLYPYELNSQKPLTELFADMPPEVRRWELEIGTVKRAHQIWIPSRTLLMQYIKILRELE